MKTMFDAKPVKNWFREILKNYDFIFAHISSGKLSKTDVEAYHIFGSDVYANKPALEYHHFTC